MRTCRERMASPDGSQKPNNGTFQSEMPLMWTRGAPTWNGSMGQASLDRQGVAVVGLRERFPDVHRHAQLLRK